MNLKEHLLTIAKRLFGGRDMNLKEHLLTIAKKIEVIEIPEYGTLYLRRMNGTERDIYKEAQFAVKDGDSRGLIKLQPLLLSLCMCDENGIRLFECVEEVQRLDGYLLDNLGQRALKLNGLTKEAIEELEKKL